MAVRIVSLFGARKKAVDGLLWFVSFFDLLLFQSATYFLRNALYIRHPYTKPLKLFLAGCLVNALSKIIVVLANGE